MVKFDLLHTSHDPSVLTNAIQGVKRASGFLICFGVCSTRFTFDQAPDSAPVWSPDSSRVAFAASRAWGNGIYQKTTNGAGKEQALVSVTGDEQFPVDWSHDRRFLLYTQVDPQTHADLWVQILSDTRWIAYASDESGRSEIHVQPFPAPPIGGTKIAISRDGGSQPR